MSYRAKALLVFLSMTLGYPLAAAPVPAGLDAVRLIGRFDTAQADTARFTWPASALEFRFIGTEAKLTLSAEQKTRFQVAVDGNVHELWVEPGEAEYVLATDLAKAEHQLRLTRLAESFTGITSVIGGPSVDGKLLPPPAAPERQLLVIGDSITAGYGVEGEDQHCPYSLETSTPLKAYAGLAARQLGADVHTIAWSGIGVWRSYGEEAPVQPTIGERRKLTLATDLASHWSPDGYHPDAIIIAIGTNDFWQGSAPGYGAAMTKMVEELKADYPNTPVYLTLSPMLGAEQRKLQASDLEPLTGSQVALLDMGKIEAADGFGCDWHPNTVTNQRMAKALVERLSGDLGW